MITEYDITSLIKDRQEYNKVKNDLKNTLTSDFTLRHMPGTIIVKDGKEEMTLGGILINLFLLSFYVESGEDVYKEDLFCKSAIRQDDLTDSFNRMLLRVKRSGGDFDKYRESIYNILNEMCDFTTKSNILAGTTIDYQDFLEAELEDPEARELFSVEIPYGLQFNEIEAIFKKKSNAILDYFDRHPERNLSAFTRSRTGLNAKQATQTLSFIGLKPTFNGGIIPKVVTSNFLHGLDNIEDWLIISKGARLALATNHKMVRISGYLTRKLSLLMIDTWHDNDYVDCGTKHYVTYDINSKEKYSMIDGRNYYDIVDGHADYEHLKTIDVNDSKQKIDLFGKKIALRSPITCCGPSKGKHICATCYGRALSKINKDINTGLVAVLLLTNVLTQRLLSAKHLLSTNTDKVEWGEDFKDAFTVNMESVYFASDTKVEFSIPYPTEDDFDEDEDAYKVETLDFKIGDEKKLIHYKSPTPLFISAANVPKKRNDEQVFKINSDSFGSDKELFKFIPHNNMLSKSLQNILDLIESSGHLGITDYNDLCNKFADLLIVNGMDSINSIHAEMICSRLLTDSKTNKAIDWTQDVIPPYSINRVSKMVMNAPVTVSLSFERLLEQFSNLETYLKDENSIMDYLFA